MTPPADAPLTPEARATVADRIAAYLAWVEKPEFVDCPRCTGKGYHHGFGEHGHDPDWCEACGGPGEVVTEPGTWSPDDLLAEALAALHATEQETREACAQQVEGMKASIQRICTEPGIGPETRELGRVRCESLDAVIFVLRAAERGGSEAQQ